MVFVQIVIFYTKNKLDKIQIKVTNTGNNGYLYLYLIEKSFVLYSHVLSVTLESIIVSDYAKNILQSTKSCNTFHSK